MSEKKEEVVDITDEKRAGDAEASRNVDALVEIQTKAAEEKVTAKPPVKPSIFINKAARHRIELDILSNKETGRIVSISRAGTEVDFEEEFPIVAHSVLWFEFSMPNYEDMSTYRQRSGIFRREAQQVIVDKAQIRNFLLVWHLKDWNLEDDKGKVELKFDENGALSDESLSRVYSLSPSLVDVVLTLFEKEVLNT